jgi:hypothetical protein
MAGLTKGIGFLGVMAFVREHFGEDGWQQVFQSLSNEDQLEMAGIIPMGWYRLELYTRLMRQIGAVHEQARPRLFEECGEFSAEQDLTTVYKAFMRFADPGLTLDQSMKLWRRFHDTGMWRIERGDKRAVGTLTDWGCVDERCCRELTGYMSTLIGLSRGKDASVHHRECRARGASACVFLANWR